MSRSGANKPSDRKPFAVRVRVGASWYYATPRRERIKLGLAGSVQVAIFSPRRSLAKRFTNRRQALSWARWMASGYPVVEIVRVGYGRLRDRTDEPIIQLHLFD